MSNLYSSSPSRKVNYSIEDTSDRSFIRLEIAKDISNYCAKPLFLSLRQMNKELVRFLITDHITKGLK